MIQSAPARILPVLTKMLLRENDMRLTLLWFCTSAFTFAVDIEPGLESLVQKIDEVNQSVQTLQARFEQKRELSLLTEPVVMTGTFYLQKPNAMKFQFDPEFDLSMTVNQEEMITIAHKEKKAERIELPKRKTDITQMLVAERLETLASYFRIGRLDQTKTTGGQTLILHPTRRKLKKKFKEIRIHINPEFLIDHIVVVQKDGDLFELKFSEISVNQEIDPSTFNVQIPEDYTVGNRVEFIFGPNSGF